MTGSGSRSLLASVVLAFVPLALAASDESFVGRPLSEALQQLQREGLDLVFTNQIVRPEMRVTSEPVSDDLRHTLDELLAPHGLLVRESSSGILVVVSGGPARADRRGSIEGRVQSREGPSPLSGATLRLLPPGRETVSSERGEFRFSGLASGTYTLVALCKGFVVERLEITVPTRSATEIEFLLAPAPVTEETVIVTPSRVSLLQEQPVGFFALGRDQLLALPHLDNDFFRALSLLPGIISNDVTAQFHVRGARRDETQILLDSQELFDSYHLQDFDYAISAIVPETISRMDLSTGGFPVEYGDRMAGVLDMTTNTPVGVPRGRVSLGILSAQAGGAGGFDHDRGNWIGQVRRGTTDFAGRIFATDAPRYWDALGKVEYELHPRHRLRLNLLHTDDKYAIEELVDGDLKSFQTSYRSSYGWLTHLGILGPSTSVESAVSVSRLDRDRNGLEREQDFQFVVSDFRDMDVFGVRQAWTHQWNSAHLMRGGFELREFDTGYDYFRSGRVDGSVGERFTEDLREDHLGLYLADSWQAATPLRIELGIRYDRYSQTDEALLSPRLNLLYDFGDEGTVRFAAGRFNQSQRPYELQIEDGETGFYPVEQSEHWIFGYERVLPVGKTRSGLALRIEAYLRSVDNPRPRYENLYEPLNTFPEVEPDRVRIAPDASRARGIELFLRGHWGPRVGWWVNYAWATTEDEIDGRWVPRLYDQPHTLNFDLDYAFADRWQLNLAGRLHSGWPLTPVRLEEVEEGSGESETHLVFGPLSSQRFPTYKRLDLRVSRIWGLRFGAVTLYVDIQNLLDSRNEAGLDIVFDEELGTLEVNREYWVGFFPSAGVIFEFWGGSNP